MERLPISSSLIASAAYDPEMNVLEVELHPGRVYQFFLVPPAAYDAFRTAPSPGGYFNREIRRKYPWVEVV